MMGNISSLHLPNLLFDLDGTLLDSLPGIQYSATQAFKACGLAWCDVDLRTLIGPPIRTILSRMGGDPSDAKLDALEQAFRVSYDCDGWRMTRHYVGASEMLRVMKTQGRRLFVVSNKPRHISVKILEAEGTLGLFEEVITRDSQTPPYQDKQEMMRSLMEREGLIPQAYLMIGDTMEDALAAAEMGMNFCLMTHGYGDVPKDSGVPVAFRLDHFSELVLSPAQE